MSGKKFQEFVQPTPEQVSNTNCKEAIIEIAEIQKRLIKAGAVYLDLIPQKDNNLKEKFKDWFAKVFNKEDAGGIYRLPAELQDLHRLNLMYGKYEKVLEDAYDLLTEHQVIHQVCGEGGHDRYGNWLRPQWSPQEITSHAEDFNNLLQVLSEQHSVIKTIQENVDKEIARKQSQEEAIKAGELILQFELPAELESWHASSKAAGKQNRAGRSYKDYYNEEVGKFQKLTNDYQQAIEEASIVNPETGFVENQKQKQKKYELLRNRFKAKDLGPSTEAVELSKALADLLKRNDSEEISEELAQVNKQVHKAMVANFREFEELKEDDHDSTTWKKKTRFSGYDAPYRAQPVEDETSATDGAVRGVLNLKHRRRLNKSEDCL